ncbi:MAG: energy-coupling factor transporter transmembrane component T [Bryobacteraceae bacterium]
MHLDPDAWSRGDSWLHRRDGRAKLLALIALLAGIGTTSAPSAYAAIVGVLALVSRLPLRGIAMRAALVLPFTMTFAAVSILGGDWARAQAVIARSLLSATVVVVAIGVTPFASLLRAAERMGAPRLLVQVTQFLYRYLFVLFDEAARMRWAAQSRGGFRWDAAGGAVAVLFASSYQRAEGIHRAMLSRGFQGSFPAIDATRFGAPEIAMTAGVVALLVAMRLIWGV